VVRVKGCAAAQTVQIQRKPVGASKSAKKKRKFKNLKRLTTNSAGKFSTKRNRTFKYRALLPESNVCDDSTSKAKKVKA
jgi:hypothetical protein